MDYDRCHELFEVVDGELIRKVSAGDMPTGSKAGWASKQASRRRGRIDGKSCLVHRVIFLMSNNYLPKYIDHVDGNSLNNRDENLREATSSQNNRNKKKFQGCSSKYIGVSWHKQCNKWWAYCRLNGIKTHLGLFLDEVEAATKVDEANREHHPEFSTFNFPQEGERSCHI